MTALARAIAARIRATGPISIAEYMGECLMHPVHGYYTTREPFGAAGDFTTAPEMTQMFGELIGLALAQVWLDQGSPAGIALAELGPGRGTLMQDALRATAGVPGFHAALEVHLVETSPRLRQAQAARVPQAIWHDSVETLPEVPLFLIANEFLDALPIRQFVRDGHGWRERVVGLEDGTLAFGLTEAAKIADLDHRLEDTRDGDLVELCPALPAIAGAIGGRIARHGGAALFIDYGDWRSLGDTLQALSRHERAGPLDAPGQSDLTAHVDFEALARAAHPARPTRLATLATFLERLGIAARTRALAQQLTTRGDQAALESHLAAFRRLTSAAEMGDLFKVMGIIPQNAPLPPGLTT
jgi:NADH dehydrogenase [ubiquinone] 1 alpha subcomplex assembly factor 7